MIEMNKGQIKKLETLHVALVYLFGSYAENKSSPLSDLDIIFLQNATLELRFDVVRHGINIYRVSEIVKSDFEDMVSMLYMDFKPILNEFDAGILKRI